MRKRVLILVVIAVVLFFGFGAVSNLVSASLVPIVGDSMDWESTRLMGRHGIDCGRVRVGGDSKAATDCTLKALGYDSAVAGGIVRTPSGELYGLSFDGDPSGQGGISLFRQHVEKIRCPQPTHLWVNPKGRINCFQQ